MLQITRQTEYAIRGLQELASRDAENPVQLKSIAKACGVSEAFLAKIFQMLSQHNIVKSHRGVKGGFSLGRSASDISLRDIVEVCEGGIALNHCLRKVDPCQNAGSCALTNTWAKAQAVLVTAMEQTSLADVS
ncbi:MAG: Rrf2 family transcriptional regulator [bacterium]